MKIESTMVKPQYSPIVITLENAAEYFCLLAALGMSTGEGVNQELSEMGVLDKIGGGGSRYELYDSLSALQSKVTETL